MPVLLSQLNPTSSQILVIFCTVSSTFYMFVTDLQRDQDQKYIHWLSGTPAEKHRTLSSLWFRYDFICGCGAQPFCKAGPKSHPVEEDLIITNERKVWFKALQENHTTGRNRVQLSPAFNRIISSRSLLLQSLCTFQLLKQRSATASVQYYKWDQTIVENSECSHPVRKNISQFKNNRGESRVMEIPFLLAFHSLVSSGLYSLNNILWSHLVTCTTI